MFELLWPVTQYAIATSITPGPNNIMVTVSGANFGYWRTFPHILGIDVGFMVMVIAIGFGMGAAFEALPYLHLVLKVVGSAYMLWLAYKIATSGPIEIGERNGQPFTFLQAAAFQWVNPKAWFMALSAIPAFTSLDGDIYREVFFIAAVFGVFNFPCVSVWTLFGVGLGRILKSPKSLRLFNWGMAALLALSILPMIL